MATQVVVRRWGNSIGVVLPKDFVAREGLREDSRILVEVVKEANLEHIFGSLKRKMSGQSFKNMVREGWKS
jgi:antitoxin component of MazEF toxin-antitoxin module